MVQNIAVIQNVDIPLILFMVRVNNILSNLISGWLFKNNREKDIALSHFQRAVYLNINDT